MINGYYSAIIQNIRIIIKIYFKYINIFYFIILFRININENIFIYNKHKK